MKVSIFKDELIVVIKAAKRFAVQVSDTTMLTKALLLVSKKNL